MKSVEKSVPLYRGDNEFSILGDGNYTFKTVSLGSNQKGEHPKKGSDAHLICPTIVSNDIANLEAVLNCLFEGLRVKNFSFDRFFQGR